MLENKYKAGRFTAVRLAVDGETRTFTMRAGCAGRFTRQVRLDRVPQPRGPSFVSRRPLIRYNTMRQPSSDPRALPRPEFLLPDLPLSRRCNSDPMCAGVVDRSMEVTPVGTAHLRSSADLQFLAPFLALNQDNHLIWLRSNPFARRALLERIVVGNLLSLSKGIGLHVEENLHANVDLSASEWHDLKPSMPLLGFRGFIQTNFLLPDGWGIGKSSSRLRYAAASGGVTWRRARPKLRRWFH